MKKSYIINAILTIIIASNLNTGNLYGQNNNCIFVDSQQVLTIHELRAEPTFSPLNEDLVYIDVLSQNSLDDRLVYWIHGLGADNSAWDKAAEAVQDGNAVFPARKAQSMHLEYAQSGNLNMDSEAFKVKNQMFLNSETFHLTEEQRENTMLIAHSQGGILSRALQRKMENQTRYFGGMITFASAHGGAYILNSANNGATEKFISEMVYSLANPIIYDQLNNFWLLDLLYDVDDWSDTLSKFAGNFLGDLVGDYFLTIKDEVQTKDYEVGSTWLSDMEDYENDPNRSFRPARVAFYSKEEDEGYLIWRTLHYFRQSPNVFDNFGANIDAGTGTLKDEVDKINEFYKDKLELKRNKYKKDCNTWFELNIWRPWDCNDLRNEIRKYEKADQWFSQANDQWKVIIGASGYQTVSLPLCICEVYDPYSNKSFVREYPNPDGADCTQKVITKYDVLEYDYKCIESSKDVIKRIEKESDGVVLTESGMALPQYTSKPEKVLGSSHMQIRNDENTRKSLKLIFNGGVGYFFKTEER